MQDPRSLELSRTTPRAALDAMLERLRGSAHPFARLGIAARGGKAAYDAAVKQSIPLGREQTPADIASAVIYLATSPNVTGVSLNVAGGMEMW